MDDRYRQLAAFHILSLDYRSAIRAMWASTLNLVEYLPLNVLAERVTKSPLPAWLNVTGESPDFPRSTKNSWEDLEGLAAYHMKVSEIAISDRVRSIHGATYYVLTGQYGFAVQCLKSSEIGDDELSMEQLAAGNLVVDEPPAWLNCWS